MLGWGRSGQSMLGWGRSGQSISGHRALTDNYAVLMHTKPEIYLVFCIPQAMCFPIPTGVRDSV